MIAHRSDASGYFFSKDPDLAHASNGKYTTTVGNAITSLPTADIFFQTESPPMATYGICSPVQAHPLWTEITDALSDFFLLLQCRYAFFQRGNFALSVSLLLALAIHHCFRSIVHEAFVSKLLLHRCQEAFIIFQVGI